MPVNFFRSALINEVVLFIFKANFCGAFPIDEESQAVIDMKKNPNVMTVSQANGSPDKQRVSVTGIVRKVSIIFNYFKGNSVSGMLKSFWTYLQSLGLILKIFSVLTIRCAAEFFKCWFE